MGLMVLFLKTVSFLAGYIAAILRVWGLLDSISDYFHWRATMRCQQCNKFVSYSDEGDVSEVTVDIIGSGPDTELTISGRIAMSCGECGTEMAEAEVDETIPLREVLTGYDDTVVMLDDENEPLEFELGDFDVEYAEETKTTDRNGKPIKNRRYMKTLRGCHVMFKVTLGETEYEGEADAMVAASDFEDCQ